MAAIRCFWLSNKLPEKSRFYKSCIFQQIWRERALSHTLGLETTTIQKKHMSYVTRYLLDSLLNHQFDDAVQCMVALCGACAKTPEMFWRKGKLQLDRRHLDDEVNAGHDHEAGDSTTANLKRQVDFLAKQALVLFSNLVEYEGNWDIFITKQVEVLKYYGKSDDTREILDRYKEKNTENPNAHRYLYFFLKSGDTDKQELCSVLEGLLQVDPTSDLNEEYVQLRIHQSDQPKGLLDALASLFLKLDHAACRNCAKTWKTFADTLQSYFTTEQHKNSLHELWDERGDWWPRFHFRPDQVPDIASTSELEWQLIQHKAEAADWLLGKGNSFSESVRNQEEIARDGKWCLDKAQTTLSRKRKTDSVFNESSTNPMKKRSRNAPGPTLDTCDTACYLLKE
ncbi:TATA box-binding protein-associated factor RNA polymerase I subunit A-like isoform X2 [Montipora foliosa]|uniref:TATA box-binding protein-associated factor RNA polymerase I subunit A-like isoform X2 n=1 Tax=Montipora foliosa TaxID=591990 RepID=UPI0035F1E467